MFLYAATLGLYMGITLPLPIKGLQTAKSNQNTYSVSLISYTLYYRRISHCKDLRAVFLFYGL